MKKEERKKETTGQKYNGLPYSIGRPSQSLRFTHYWATTRFTE